MKYRESGMPSEEVWDSFFNPIEILKQMGVGNSINTMIDLGCGYGTFLLPASELVDKQVIGIDIDEEMIEVCKKKVQDRNIKNIDLISGDIANEDTLKKLYAYKSDINYITLFNILHCENPINLLRNTYEVLSEDGKIGVIHWKYEETPRGPSMEIRPKPQNIIEWASKVGFTLVDNIDVPPYHFGLIFKK